jgi:hypothetical protein
MPEARKPLLDDATIQAFVKGNGFQRHPEAPAPEPVVEEPEPEQEPEPQILRNAAGLESLRASEREATVRFTVDLRVSQHKKLKMAALETELPMTKLIRHIIADWLVQNDRG